MIDKNEVFTFTLIYRDEDEKVIFIKRGEVPAKSEEEAETVLTSTNEDEKDAIDKIISKLFKDSEPGSEDSISASLSEFEDRYDISLEDLEEEVGTDLDSDNEHEEGEEHAEKVLDNEDEHEDELKAPESFERVAIISFDDLTDPTSILGKSSKNRYTSPADYLEEELPEYAEEDYDPIAVNESEEEETELEEGASVQQLAQHFFEKAAATKKGVFNRSEVTEIFNLLHVTDRDAKYEGLRFILRTGNVKVFQTPGQPASHGRLEIAGNPMIVIKGTPEAALPPGAIELSPNDPAAINQALSKLV